MQAELKSEALQTITHSLGSVETLIVHGKPLCSLELDTTGACHSEPRWPQTLVLGRSRRSSRTLHAL